jgi:NAD(P)-dependent dehydrogenase (short-subunit alcohol dehydrogenase family)
MDDLTGKVAVVTGGASGIGYAMASAFRREGMSVAIGDVEEAALADAVERLRAEDGPGDVVGVGTDVADLASVEALRDEALEALGGAHVVCNNAGVAAGGLLWETTEADWQWILGVNLMGVVHGIQAFVPGFLEQGEGYVVNTASMAGVTSPPFMGPYNATKHAAVTISETLYAELQMMTAGAVGVSVLCPGWVRTQIHRSDRNRPESLLGEAPNAFAEGGEGGPRSVLEGLIADGLEPDDVAQLVLDGIADDRFYLFTHDDWSPMVERRATALLAGENPWVGPPPGVPAEGAPVDEG